MGPSARQRLGGGGLCEVVRLDYATTRTTDAFTWLDHRPFRRPLTASPAQRHTHPIVYRVRMPFVPQEIAGTGIQRSWYVMFGFDVYVFRYLAFKCPTQCTYTCPDSPEEMIIKERSVVSSLKGAKNNKWEPKSIPKSPHLQPAACSLHLWGVTSDPRSPSLGHQVIVS